MTIGNDNYMALLHVILFILSLWILATSTGKKENDRRD
jgi:hypothetical protein